MSFSVDKKLKNWLNKEAENEQKVREQQELCAQIFCGVLFRNWYFASREECTFIYKVRRATKVLPDYMMSAARKVKERMKRGADAKPE